MASQPGVGPLNHGVPITDPKTGYPTPEFIRKWAQQNGFNGDISALAAAVAALQARLIIAGPGLAGGGPLSADVTLQLSLTTLARLIPSGGLTNQVLAKLSAADYDVGWIAAGAGGGNVIIGTGVPTTLEAAGTLYSRSDAAEVYTSQPIPVVGPAPPTIVQSVKASGTTTTVVASLPSAPTVGNLLVAFISKFQTFTINAAWTLAETQPDANSGNLRIVYRYVQPGDTAGPWTFATGIGAFWHVVGFYELSSVSGVWATDYVQVAKGVQAAPTPHTTTNIVTGGPQRRGLIAFSCPQAAAPAPGDLSAGWTLDKATTGSGFGTGMATQTFATAGLSDQLTIAATWPNSFSMNYISAVFAGVGSVLTPNWVLISNVGDVFETSVLRTYAGFVLDTGDGSFLDLGAQ